MPAIKARFGKSLLETKYPIRSARYRGWGRPRKVDYDYKTLIEIQKSAYLAQAKKIDKLFNLAFTKEG